MDEKIGCSARPFVTRLSPPRHKFSGVFTSAACTARVHPMQSSCEQQISTSAIYIAGSVVALRTDCDHLRAALAHDNLPISENPAFTLEVTSHSDLQQGQADKATF